MIEINKDELERYINAGFSSNKIAGIIGISLRTMSSKIRKLGLRTKQAIVMQDTKYKYERAPKMCKNCNEVLPYEKRKNAFCDHSCAALFHLTGARRKEIYYCLNCGDIIKGSGKKYCSHKCQQKFQWNKEVEIANREDDISKVFSMSNSSRIKKYLVEIRGHKCEICGRKTWCGDPIPLVLDHVDGNADNNMKSNLKLVCGNCNMQLPTYGGRNLGKGRKWRRDYRKRIGCQL